jgi:hypothetical protein
MLNDLLKTPQLERGRSTVQELRLWYLLQGGFCYWLSPTILSKRRLDHAQGIKRIDLKIVPRKLKKVDSDTMAWKGSATRWTALIQIKTKQSSCRRLSDDSPKCLSPKPWNLWMLLYIIKRALWTWLKLFFLTVLESELKTWVCWTSTLPRVTTWALFLL